MIPLFLKMVWRTIVVRRRYSEFSSIAPLPLDRWLAIRDIERDRYGCKDILFPVAFRKGTHGYHGTCASLKNALSGVELGTWAIDEDTIDFLWKRLDSIHPDTILEFGSGSSTIVFSVWMKQNNPNGRVISIDQNEWAANQTLERLSELQLGKWAEVLVFSQNENDQFIIAKERITSTLKDQKIDLLFSDGPAGKAGCRANTLPDCIPFLSNISHWFLHDSLRDPELEILRNWSAIPGILVEGVVPLGNGLAVGQYKKPAE